MDYLLDLKQLTVSFGAVRAIDNITISIRAEQSPLGIIGANGAGKTTLLSALTGYVRRTAGQVVVNGRTIESKDRPHTLVKAGIVRTFQVPNPFPKLSVEENVQVGAYGSGLPKRAWANEVAQVLDIVELSAKGKELAGALSLVDRKRLELAKAMICHPTTMLVDEVFEGLSKEEGIQIGEALVRWHREHNRKLILVEHVLSALERVVDTTMVMEKGAILMVGPLKTVLADARVRKSYLGIDK